MGWGRLLKRAVAGAAEAARRALGQRPRRCAWGQQLGRGGRRACRAHQGRLTAKDWTLRRPRGEPVEGFCANMRHVLTFTHTRVALTEVTVTSRETNPLKASASVSDVWGVHSGIHHLHFIFLKDDSGGGMANGWGVRAWKEGPVPRVTLERPSCRGADGGWKGGESRRRGTWFGGSISGAF